MKRDDKPLSELAAGMRKYPQVLVNARVSEQDKLRYQDDEVIQGEIRKIEAQFKEDGRVLIRPSGTEPVVRIMIEGTNQREIEEAAVRLAVLIEQRLRWSVVFLFSLTIRAASFKVHIPFWNDEAL